MEAEQRGREKNGAGRGGGGVRNHRPVFHWNKVIPRQYKGRNKVSYKWGSGDQAEFFKNPIEITIMIIIIV